MIPANLDARLLEMVESTSKEPIDPMYWPNGRNTRWYLCTCWDALNRIRSAASTEAEWSDVLKRFDQAVIKHEAGRGTKREVNPHHG